MANRSDGSDGAPAAAVPARTTLGRLVVTSLGAALAAGVAVALGACARSLAAGRGPAQVDVVVEIAVVGVGALVAAWLAVSAALAAVCLVVRVAGARWRSGERAVHRFAPALVRRSLAIAVTAGIGAGLAPAAYAADAPPVPDVTATAAVGANAVDLGWVVTASAPAARPASSSPSASTVPSPAAVATPGTGAGAPESPASPSASAPPQATAAARTVPTDAAQPEPSDAGPETITIRASDDVTTGGRASDDDTTNTHAPSTSRTVAAAPGTGGARTHTTGATRTDGATVVVRAGDSLWRIAARHLPHDADAAQIATEWPRWYAANRSTIGDDPGLLLPGQVLVVPDGAGR